MVEPVGGQSLADVEEGAEEPAGSSAPKDLVDGGSFYEGGIGL